MAPPSALPRPAGRRDRRRVARARRLSGVTIGDGVVLGRDVIFDLGDGAEVAVADGVALGDGCRLHLAPGAAVSIGPATRLGDRCAITARSSVAIGARCLFADEVVLIDAEPRTEDVERPVREQGLEASPISVGDEVRIGPSAVLLRGATVSAGATVPARATVRP